MALQLGDIAPDFTQDSTEGSLNFYTFVVSGTCPGFFVSSAVTM